MQSVPVITAIDNVITRNMREKEKETRKSEKLKPQ